MVFWDVTPCKQGTLQPVHTYSRFIWNISTYLSDNNVLHSRRSQSSPLEGAQIYNRSSAKLDIYTTQLHNSNLTKQRNVLK